MKKKTLLKKASLSMAMIMMLSITPLQAFADDEGTEVPDV